MKRKKFLKFTGAAIPTADGVGYLFSDKSNYVRADKKRWVQLPI